MTFTNNTHTSNSWFSSFPFSPLHEVVGLTLGQASCPKGVNEEELEGWMFEQQEYNGSWEKAYWCALSFTAKSQKMPREAQARAKKIPKDTIYYHPTQKTNLYTRQHNIFKKLRKLFEDNSKVNTQNLEKAKVLYTNGEYKEDLYDNNVIICNDVGDVDVAFFKSILQEELVVELEQLFLQAYRLRMKESEKTKRTIYTGLWSKMNPMNYVVKNNNNPSGQLVISEIIPKLSDIGKIFLQVIHAETLMFFNKLPPTAKPNDAVFPCSATNFLLENQKHRVTCPHKDNSDFQMTMIFIFGKINAPLLLPNQKTSFNTERGDLIMLKGCNFAHHVDVARLENAGNSQSELNMRVSFVLFGHKSLKEKPIYHLSKKLALEKFDDQYPVEAAERRQRLAKKKIRQEQKRKQESTQELNNTANKRTKKNKSK